MPSASSKCLTALARSQLDVPEFGLFIFEQLVSSVSVSLVADFCFKLSISTPYKLKLCEASLICNKEYELLFIQMMLGIAYFLQS